MGNTGSQAAAAAAAGSAIEKRIKKEKKRAKRFCCCCVWFNIASIVSLIVGIALLVLFASSLGSSYSRDSPSQDTAKGLTYTGIAFLILGLVLLLLGIIFAIALYFVYRKLNGKSSSKPFIAPKYAQGTAPYPQQDWGEVPNPHHPEAAAVPQSNFGYGEESTTHLITAEVS